MNSELKKFAPVAQAICALLHPHGEVVIHDLAKGTIAAIYNNMSKRKTGDESLLEELKNIKKFPDVFPSYYKTNWDGKKMRSMTATLRNNKEKPIGLLCINLDISKWEEMHQFLLGFMQEQASADKPEFVFKDDWRDKINGYVSDYLKREHATIKNLSKEKKRELVLALHRDGAFDAKNAATYVADILDLSRATIYNYLR